MQLYRNKKVTLTDDQRKQYQDAAEAEERGRQSTMAQARRAMRCGNVAVTPSWPRG